MRSWLLLRSPPPQHLPRALQSGLEEERQVPGWWMDAGGLETVHTTLAGPVLCAAEGAGLGPLL